MPSKATETPGAVVRRLREARGWTVYRLAREAGLAQQTVSRWEAGGEASLATAMAVCRALGCSLAELDPPSLAAGPTRPLRA